MWRGGTAFYASVHAWVQKHRPKTGVCQWCGAAGYTGNANVDHQYRRVLDDYLELCAPCHHELDEEAQ